MARGNNSSAILACVGMLVVQFSFGGYSAVCSYFKSEMPNPVVFSMFRDLSTFPILLAGAAIFEGLVFPSLGDLKMLFSFGLIGMYGNQVLFILGLFEAGGDLASIMQPMIPVITTVLAIVSGTEPFPVLCNREGMKGKNMVLAGWMKVFGIFLVTVGGIIISVFSGKHTGVSGGNRMLGIWMLLGNCCCCSVYILLQKRYVYEADSKLGNKWKSVPINLTAWTYCFGAICMGCHSLCLVWIEPDAFKLNPTFVYPLLYAAFLSSGLAYALISIANRRLPSSIVTAFWPVQVPVSVVLNFYINAQQISIMQGFGGILIAAALLLVCYSNHLLEHGQGARVSGADQLPDTGGLLNQISEQDVFDDYERTPRTSSSDRAQNVYDRLW